MPKKFLSIGFYVCLVLVVCTFITGSFSWQIVSGLDSTIYEADQTVTALDDALTVTETLLNDTSAAMHSLGTSLNNLEVAASSGTQSIRDASDLTSSLPGNLDNIATSLDQTRGAAESVDSITETLASAPLVGRGIEGTSLGPAIDKIASDLDPLIADLAATSESLASLADDTDELTADIPEIATHLATLETDLAKGATSMGQLSASLQSPIATTRDLTTIKLIIALATVILIGVELLLGLVLKELAALERVDIS